MQLKKFQTLNAAHLLAAEQNFSTTEYSKEITEKEKPRSEITSEVEVLDVRSENSPKGVNADTFQKGSKFDTFEELESVFATFCRQRYCYYARKSTKFFDKSHKNVPGKLAACIFACIHQPKNTKSASETPQKGCPFILRISYQRKIHKYVVTEFVSEHQGHKTDEKYYRSGLFFVPKS